jgi:electron transfer flavoprotein alpha subunit
MFRTARRVVAERANGLINQAPTLALRAYTRQRLLSTLAVLEQKDGQLNHGSLSAFTAAKKLGGSVHGFIAGANIQTAAEQAAKIDGVEKIITVDNAAYEKVRSRSLGSAV